MPVGPTEPVLQKQGDLLLQNQVSDNYPDVIRDSSYLESREAAKSMHNPQDEILYRESIKEPQGSRSIENIDGRFSFSDQD